MHLQSTSAYDGASLRADSKHRRAEPARAARALRRAIAQLEFKRATRADLIQALEDYSDALWAEIVEDCAALRRLRSAAARLEWRAANPEQPETTGRAA